MQLQVTFYRIAQSLSAGSPLWLYASPLSSLVDPWLVCSANSPFCRHSILFRRRLDSKFTRAPRNDLQHILHRGMSHTCHVTKFLAWSWGTLFSLVPDCSLLHIPLIYRASSTQARSADGQSWRLSSLNRRDPNLVQSTGRAMLCLAFRIFH